jgi:cytochrome c biogenesis protein CcmG/thiol:disulfide interchange protein DsbE
MSDKVGPGDQDGAPSEAPEVQSGSSGLRLRFILPVVLFVVLAVVLLAQLLTGSQDIPSALIDKPIPEFDLPPVENTELGLASADLREGQISLVNVFASWCGPCRVEHPLLMELAAKGTLPIHGINYKDAPEDASRWLARYGNPYARAGADIDGRVGIEWGVYGVPETFVIDETGRIVYKHIGVLTQSDLDEKILPLIESIRK